MSGSPLLSGASAHLPQSKLLQGRDRLGILDLAHSDLGHCLTKGQHDDLRVLTLGQYPAAIK